MDLSIDPSLSTLDCDGAFEVTLTFKNNVSAGDSVSVRVLHQPQYDKNVLDVQLDHALIALKPSATHQVVVSGRLVQRCNTGEFDVGWFQTIGGVAVPGTRDDLLFVVPPLPFIADENADPVVADPAGVFRYSVALKCCRDGIALQQRSVDYQVGTVDVEHCRVTPQTPVTLDCPADESKVLDVVGILEDPKRAGKVSIKISGGGRCTVDTRIRPNTAPDRAAHRLAVQEWED